MRAPSEDLFRLVKAMNKGEKRNFKLLAGMLTGDKKYIDLFDQVDRQNVYDESKILKSGINKGQLSVAKNYLFKFMLKSLVYARSNPYSELVHLSEQVRILMSKHLYPQAGKILKKALQKATGLEAFSLHLELLDLEAKLLMLSMNGKNVIAKLEVIQQEKSRVLDEIQYLHELNHLHHQVKYFQNVRLKIKAPHEINEISQMMDHSLLKQGEPDNSIRAKLVYLKIKRKLCSYQDKPEEAAKHCLRLLEVYRSSEPLLETELGDYFLELSNLCTYYFRSGRIDESLQLMDSFREARSKYRNGGVEFFQRYYILQMGYAIYVGDPSHGFAYLDELENELKHIKGKIPTANLRWLFYLIGYLFFMDSKPKEALKWIDRFFAEPRTDYLEDLPGFAKLLKMLIYYDLKEFSLLESETVNVQKFLDRKGKHTTYEYEVIKGLRHLVRKIGLLKDREVYEETLQEFIGARSGSIDFHDILNFELWLQAKLAGTSMSTLHRSKFSESKS